jgi:hypothetical protein
MMIQENWDDSVRTDVVHLLQKLIPRGVWLHDQQDGNGDAHLKAGLVGPSETFPLLTEISVCRNGKTYSSANLTARAANGRWYVQSSPMIDLKHQKQFNHGGHGEHRVKGFYVIKQLLNQR